MSFPITATSNDAPPVAGTRPTAVVYDYGCLFTHDLRRKQKRWQDGQLKYHTFNKRVMVYDDRGNFIGDAHRQGDRGLQEGEELALDRGGAIVQVADCTGSHQQDLTDLLHKRARDAEGTRPETGAGRLRRQRQTQSTHLSLRTVVPNSGPIGRAAIPDRSPFESRVAEAALRDDGAAKRRRRNSDSSPNRREGYAKNLFGAKLTLSSVQPPAASSARAKPWNLERRVRREAMAKCVEKATTGGSIADEPVSTTAQKGSLTSEEESNEQAAETARMHCADADATFTRQSNSAVLTTTTTMTTRSRRMARGGSPAEETAVVRRMPRGLERAREDGAERGRKVVKADEDADGLGLMQADVRPQATTSCSTTESHATTRKGEARTTLRIRPSRQRRRLLIVSDGQQEEQEKIEPAEMAWRNVASTAGTEAGVSEAKAPDGPTSAGEDGGVDCYEPDRSSHLHRRSEETVLGRKAKDERGTGTEAAACVWPRLARLARRSVKSKEILGLQRPNDGALVPAAFAAATARIGFGHEGDEDQQDGNRPSEVGVGVRAGRGQPAGEAARSLVREAGMGMEPRGGAWSREAEDLLGMVRPARAMRGC